MKIYSHNATIRPIISQHIKSERNIGQLSSELKI